MFRLKIILFFCCLPVLTFGQYNWELERDDNGIKVYSSKLTYTNFKAIKVEGVFEGEINMLLNLLTDVHGMKGWVYKTENIELIDSTEENGIIFYSETDLPWPVANRDAVIHLKIDRDSLPNYVTIKGTCDPDGVPKNKGIVRLSHFFANWKITLLQDKRMHIEYIVEVDPGGDMPAWINNLFIVKGPYQTFSNLAEKLKEQYN